MNVLVLGGTRFFGIHLVNELRSDEAGNFMAFMAEQTYTGEINGSSYGTISIKEILAYVEEKTGKKAVLSEDGEKAPYNGEKAYSINTERANKLGFQFTNLKDWFFDLVDEYIRLAGNT